MKQNQDAIRREQQLQNKIDEQFAEIGRQSALLQEYLTDSTKTSLPQPEKYASSSLTDEKKQDYFCVWKRCCGRRRYLQTIC